MRLRVPVRDYIIDTSSEPDRDYYDFLAEPPVEQVERVYSIDEVRNSARIRDKVRRIDLDTITFATGSAEVPMSQAKTLRKVADAMLRGHREGSGRNLLHRGSYGRGRRRRVEPRPVRRTGRIGRLAADGSLRNPGRKPGDPGLWRALPQGPHGWKPEQENRRVTIRRVTPLVRPVAPELAIRRLESSCGRPGDSARRAVCVGAGAVKRVGSRPTTSPVSGKPRSLASMKSAIAIVSLRSNSRQTVYRRRDDPRRSRTICGSVGASGSRFCRLQPPRLDLRDRFALVAFDQYEVAGSKARRGFPRKARFRGAAQFMHDGIAGAGDDGHLMGAGLRGGGSCRRRPCRCRNHDGRA